MRNILRTTNHQHSKYPEKFNNVKEGKKSGPEIAYARTHSYGSLAFVLSRFHCILCSLMLIYLYTSCSLAFCPFLSFLKILATLLYTNSIIVCSIFHVVKGDKRGIILCFIPFLIYHACLMLFVHVCFLHYTLLFFLNCLLNDHGCQCAIKLYISYLLTLVICMGGQIFLPGYFGHGRFGQIKIQSRTYWPNAISTQKEALYELFMLVYIQFK